MLALQDKVVSQALLISQVYVLWPDNEIWYKAVVTKVTTRSSAVPVLL